MQVKSISVLVLLLTISSIQWGVSSGEEDPNVREKRHFDYYYYTFAYDYYIYGPGSPAAISAYVISALFGLCLCCIPCVILGIVGCVAICVAGNVENNSRKASTSELLHPDSQNYCRLQSYVYPQNAAESHLVKAVNENDSIDT